VKIREISPSPKEAWGIFFEFSELLAGFFDHATVKILNNRQLGTALGIVSLLTSTCYLQMAALNLEKEDNYAFAEYLVPRASIPPWKSKTSTFDIFNWEGVKKEHRIMNWGIDIGRNSTKISGELIDQTDRVESEALGKALLLNDRAREIAKFQETVDDKIDAVFTGINLELNSERNLQLSKYKGFFQQQADGSEEKIKALHQGLQVIL
jgi:hypothetical protein